MSRSTLVLILASTSALLGVQSSLAEPNALDPTDRAGLTAARHAASSRLSPPRPSRDRYGLHCAIEGEWVQHLDGQREYFAWDARWTPDRDGWSISGPFQDSYGVTELAWHCGRTECALIQSYYHGDLAGQTFEWDVEYDVELGHGQSRVHVVAVWGAAGEALGEARGTGACIE